MANNIPHSPIIVACDKPSRKEAIVLAKQLDATLCRLKVGKELFTQSGPGIIEDLMALGFDIFLDLKFHDIPNTVAKACFQAASLGVWMLNVHTLGGEAMLFAAKEAVNKANTSPLLIGVTLLTSLSNADIKQLGFKESIETLAPKLAQLAQKAGLDGIVSSAIEAPRIREVCPSPFLIVSPGIRLTSNHDDQKRVLTPNEALHHGSDYLVIGRPITEAKDPNEQLNSIITSLTSNKEVIYA